MKIVGQQELLIPFNSQAQWPILICLLGNFLLLKFGQPVTLRNGWKTKALLSYLALQQGWSIPRDMLLQLLWPDNDPALSSQSLHSLVYSLHKLVGSSIGGVSPVYYEEGCYRLNLEAGVGVDVAWFDALSKAGDHWVRAGDQAKAIGAYQGAAALYRGDLCADMDLPTLIERERLRARYLTILAHLADLHYTLLDYSASLEYAWRLLARDPCREDAHRLVMQCYVRQGERAEALHQYHICAKILRSEFDTTPETVTTRLFEQIRLDPDSI
ncbi:MAG TPA: BTAD domain-containing putative transcriptional regulator [Caldilineaceae bacterium]|nr:BTAD domain-containing putative transcriptional regulator [Caldilineaceae bacterium]